MKIDDHYRAALIELNEIAIASKEPAPKAYHLYLFPEIYVYFKEETLPNVIKYKMGAIGANKETPRPMYGTIVDLPNSNHGWRLEGINGFCLILSEKTVRDLRRKFMDVAIEPIMTKEVLVSLQHAQVQQAYGQMAQQQMMNQQAMAGQLSSSNNVVWGNLSGAAQPYQPGSCYSTVSTTSTSGGQGFWSSIGNALGVI
jgi:hypothetical protein